MSREHPQSLIPRVAGYSVQAIAESVADQGLAATAEQYRLSAGSIQRALNLWEKWRRRQALKGDY